MAMIEPAYEVAAVRRGSGSSMCGRFCAKRGRPVEAGGSDPKPGERPGRRREAERCIVPVKPGNAGGGKAPHFRVLEKERKGRDWRCV